MSVAGDAFLKCAFAPPDFNADPGKGIPDSYNGKSFMDKNCYVNTFQGTAGKDDYYVVAPTPGVAFWYTQTNTGVPPAANALWAPFYHNGCFGTNSLFGDATTGYANRADNVEAFRFASLAAGVYTTSNMVNTAGSIQIWKMPISLADEMYVKTVATTPPVTIEAVSKVVNGLDGAGLVPRDNYSQGLIHGAYTVSTNNQAEFEFQPIIEGVNRLPSNNYTGSGMHGVLNGPVLGVGSFDAICIKVSSPAGAANSFILKTWACVEYRPTADSIFDRFSGTSPAYDPVAMANYRKVANQMPLAVVSAENAKFWQTVLSILGFGANAMSYVPGPVGVMGAAASTIVQGLREFT